METTDKVTVAEATCRWCEAPIAQRHDNPDHWLHIDDQGRPYAECLDDDGEPEPGSHASPDDAWHAVVAAAKRHEFIEGLRLMADFYNANPDLPMPYLGGINVHCHSRDELRTATRTLMRGQACAKEWDEYGLSISRAFRGATLRLSGSRFYLCTKQPTDPRTGETRTICPPLLAPAVAS